MFELTVSPLGWKDFWLAGGEALFAEHKRELDFTRWPLAPDHRLIEELEENGVALLMAAHRGDFLVGYAVWYISPSLECRGILMASQGPLFVVPSERKSGRAAAKLWSESLAALRARGVRELEAHAATDSPESLYRFLDKRGKRTYQVWSVEI